MRRLSRVTMAALKQETLSDMPRCLQILCSSLSTEKDRQDLPVVPAKG